MIMGTKIWPDSNEWAGTILFLETSELYPSPDDIRFILRGMAAQGIIGCINGILFGKPYDEKYYEEYKQVLTQVIGKECGRPDLPILYNLNFGHTSPICILPYGITAEIDCNYKSVHLLESAVI